MIHIIPFFASFITTMILLKILQPFAFDINLVDKPNHRKSHEGNVPLIGGIAIMGGFAVSSLVTPRSLNEWRPLFLSMMPLLVVGILDDHRDIRVRIRLIVQTITCLIMIYYADIRISTVGNLLGIGNIKLEGIQTIFTIFCVISVLNALNLIDGIDGLCTTLTIIALTSIIVLVKLKSYTAPIALVVYFLAALIAFLIVNLGFLNKYIGKVFLGDAGTTVIGFFLCWMFVKFSQNETPLFRPITTVWLLAIPIMDTLAVMYVRLKSGKSPFESDRQHIHHHFMNLGFSKLKTLILLNISAITLAILGIIAEFKQIQEWIMFYGIIIIFLVYLKFVSRLQEKITK